MNETLERVHVWMQICISFCSCDPRSGGAAGFCAAVKLQRQNFCLWVGDCQPGGVGACFPLTFSELLTCSSLGSSVCLPLAFEVFSETFTFLNAAGWAEPKQITFWAARSTFHWVFFSKYGKPKPGWLPSPQCSSQWRPADTCRQGGVVLLLEWLELPGFSLLSRQGAWLWGLAFWLVPFNSTECSC